MIHFIGAICLVLSGAVFANIKVSQLKLRTDVLSSMISSLLWIRSEISTNLTPVTELVQCLAADAHPSVRPFFQAVHEQIDAYGIPYFAQCWQRAVQIHCEALSEDEFRVLCDLGGILGRYGVQEENTAIDRCIQQFQAAYEQARQDRTERTRLYLGIGLTAGGMLAIVLL